MMTFWGSLVMVASSSPVAVAGMMPLAWDVGRGSVRLANRWVGAALAAAEPVTPSLVAPVGGGEPWGIQHTKALTPTLEAAAARGTGAEFFLAEAEHKIKLTILPRTP
jgi:hypothetical protein